ncbi:MAG: heparan-alpha-glucosaminide N-acetyltransferase domain-containing protein, partial [Methyloceanibacter sp.]
MDHTRDFFSGGGWNPRDVTDPALFLTRWITHFCAPTFIFLAGLAAYLYGARGRSLAETSRFLFTRGLWLILIEFTVVKLAWTFSFNFDQLAAGVIWAIGASMVVLAALVYLPRVALAIVAVVLIVGHNLLDGIRAENLRSVGWVWYFLHQPGFVRLGNGTTVFVLYPLIPWIGVMAAGYALGPVMELDAEARRRQLLRLGAAITAGFVLLRATNLYGDPAPWTMGETWSATVLSFLN